ncbi:MAG: LLM class flavin-dependent oxidoreductase [Candidatus Eremiobacterota bacterium]
MRFGVFVPQGWRLDLTHVPAGHAQWRAMVDVAQRAERHGYDGVWLYDHFHTVPEARKEATFEAWTALTGLAALTSRIRLGHMCGCSMYRPPALVAKIAANVDVISNGRLEFGYGAGWYMHETVAYGYPFPSAADRIKSLEEALTIVRGLWQGGPFQFEGKYHAVGKGQVRDYRGAPTELAGALNYPVPVQKPHPPIWVAGGGEQLTLKVVARHANYANYFGDMDGLNRKHELLDRYCEAIGRDPAEIVRTANLNVMVGDEAEVDRILLATGRSAADVSEWKKGAYIGTPEHLAERVARLRDHARIGYFLLYFPDAAGGESLERFAAEVLPLLGAARAPVR